MSWRDRAKCQSADAATFFPNEGQQADDARRICQQCPVTKPCLEYALEHGLYDGVWGGTSASQRRALRQPSHRQRLAS